MQELIPPPVLAVRGLPGWCKSMPQKSFGQGFAHAKKSQASTDGFLIPLAVDLEVKDGDFSHGLDASAQTAV
jgi:hypothetical protein